MGQIIRKARIVENSSGQWRVQAVGGNDEIIMTSENYVNKEWAESVATDLNVPVLWVPFRKPNG